MRGVEERLNLRHTLIEVCANKNYEGTSMLRHYTVRSVDSLLLIAIITLSSLDKDLCKCIISQ